jgi:hypothetical protein
MIYIAVGDCSLRACKTPGPSSDFGADESGREQIICLMNQGGLMTHHITGTSQLLLLALSTLVVVVATMAPAHAGVALKDYVAAKNAEGFRQYLDGIGAGFRQANAELQLRRMKKLFCEPPNAVLQYDTYTSVLEREVKENEAFYTVETPVETPLLFGLMKTYPCR